MNNHEPQLFRLLRDNLTTYWKILPAIPIVDSALRNILYLTELEYFPYLFIFSLLLGQLPDVLVYLLFLKYLGMKEATTQTSTPRLSITTNAQTELTGSLREFCISGAKRWAICYGLVWLFTFRYGTFQSFTGSLLDCAVTIGAMAFLLRELRSIQAHDAHDSAPRIIGAAAIYLSLMGTARSIPLYFFTNALYTNTLFIAAALALTVVVLWSEQRRYAFVQAVYHKKSPNHIIEPIDLRSPPNDIPRLAYWPSLVIDGALLRVEQGNAKDDPFRSNEVKVPLFLVPTQAEPLVSLLSKRLQGYIALLLFLLFCLFH